MSLTNESSHGNTTMLNLRMTKESNSGLVGLSPDSGGSKLKRIVVLENGVRLLSDSDKIVHGSLGGDRSGLASLGGEGSRRGEEGGDDGKLHDDGDERLK